MGRGPACLRAAGATWIVTVAAAAFALAPGAAAAPRHCPDSNLVPSAATVHQAREAVLCLVNRERARHGRHALRASQSLNLAAGRHSLDMVHRRYFSHDGPGGHDVADRVRAAHWAPGRSAWRLGENIAWGTGRYGTPRSIVSMWMHSSGHRANILDRRYHEFGAGVAAGAPIRWPGGAGTYTMDFGG